MSEWLITKHLNDRRALFYNKALNIDLVYRNFVKDLHSLNIHNNIFYIIVQMYYVEF